MDRPTRLRTGALAAEALRSLASAPFAFLAVIGLLVWGVSRSVNQLDGGGMLSLLFLTIVGAYVHIATVLAAADPEPAASADTWLRAAFVRRTFWRYTFTELGVVLLVLLGAVLFIIPSFFVGAAIGMAAPAAVLEHHLPAAALRRSYELSDGHRLATGTIYGAMIWTPLLFLQVGYGLGWDRDLGAGWLVLEGALVLIEMAGVIALTRAFLALGGRVLEDRPRSDRT